MSHENEADPLYVPNTYRRNGVYYGTVEVDGHHIRESLGTRDPVEAARKVERWLAEKSPRHASAQLTFKQVASSWIEAYQRQHTKKTWDRYKTSLKMLAPFFGELIWSEVNRSAIINFMNERRKGGVTAATINRDLAVLSNIFEHAIDQEWASENPVHSLSKKARRERRSPFVLPPDDVVEAVFDRAKSTFGDLCRFALLTGMRRDEIVYLVWEKNVLLDRRQVQLFVTKNGTVRVIDLCDAAVAILEKQKTREGYVFVTRNGGHYLRTTENWRDLVLRAERRWYAQQTAQSAKRPFVRFRFHDLRHMFAINYLRSGGNIYMLQLTMGHSTIRQTEDYLKFLTPEEQLVAKGTAHNPAHTTPVLQVVKGGKD